ncbi:unnamed protein product [Darwinula stevensoni]|uniref:Mitochondrial fission process protein 1 n=1 Tax=Darwinula stevensoni TaxID=69355 RepID=A0A7R9A400_9CRUS|nr:unnamed protein product [Darwinula stevensoni]CAG0892639.1 unnamed protein product [Darwinula stevensoni]
MSEEPRGWVERVTEVPPNPVDVYRHSPVRLLGYANEVGEAFRALVHVNWVRLSYVIASTYVLADTLDKARRVAQSSKTSPLALRRTRITHSAIDTLLWQSFASVLIPGFTINRLCALARLLLRARAKAHPWAHRWAPTALGLAAIPFIVRPIDAAVDRAMDFGVRPFFRD